MNTLKFVAALVLGGILGGAVGIGFTAHMDERAYDMQQRMNERNLAALASCRVDVAQAAQIIDHQNRVISAAQQGPNGAAIMQLILGALKR